MTIINFTAVGELDRAFWMGESWVSSRFVGYYSAHEHLLGDFQEILPRTDVALHLWDAPMHC